MLFFIFFALAVLLYICLPIVLVIMISSGIRYIVKNSNTEIPAINFLRFALNFHIFRMITWYIWTLPYGAHFLYFRTMLTPLHFNYNLRGWRREATVREAKASSNYGFILVNFMPECFKSIKYWQPAFTYIALCTSWQKDGNHYMCITAEVV